MSTIPNYSTVREAASRVGVTDARVRQLIISKQLKATKLGENMWLIKDSDVDRIANQERRKGGRPRISD